MDSLVWDGVEFTSRLKSGALLLDSSITGFGRGLHRLSVTDRLVGGQHVGRSVPGPRVIEAEGWSLESQTLSTLAERMGASAELLPLQWRGLGWGPRELQTYVVPAALDWDIGPHSTVDVVEGVRCQWLAPDPTVYSVETVPFAGVDQAPARYTNAGTGQPPRGLGGHAWTVEITFGWGDHPLLTIESWEPGGAAPVASVTLTPPPGIAAFSLLDEIVIGPDRLPMLRRGSTMLPVVARSGSPLRPNPDWPRFPGGQPLELRFGPASVLLHYTGEFRHTWS